MANKGYALILDLTDKPVLVIGAGPVAEWKISKLLETGAKITVISPDATERVREWAKASQLTWEARVFAEPDVDGYTLVFTATNDHAVNECACARARAKGIWVNNVDDAELGDVIVPAQFTRGKLHLAVTTGGSSPALASEISQALQLQYGPEYEPYTEFLFQCRAWLNANLEDLNERRIRLNIVMYSPLLETIRKGEPYEALQDDLWRRITGG